MRFKINLALTLSLLSFSANGSYPARASFDIGADGEYPLTSIWSMESELTPPNGGFYYATTPPLSDLSATGEEKKPTARLPTPSALPPAIETSSKGINTHTKSVEYWRTFAHNVQYKLFICMQRASTLDTIIKSQKVVIRQLSNKIANLERRPRINQSSGLPKRTLTDETKPDEPEPVPKKHKPLDK